MQVKKFVAVRISAAPKAPRRHTAFIRESPLLSARLPKRNQHHGKCNPVYTERNKPPTKAISLALTPAAPALPCGNNQLTVHSVLRNVQANPTPYPTRAPADWRTDSPSNRSSPCRLLP